MKAGIENKDYDKSKSKRKKEGIFYTPEYITKYIVENAVGGWLDDRKKELGFYELPELTDSDKESILQRIKKPTLRISNNAKKHLDYWTEYREKLSNIKVLDPACGSGAFLNQAFNYLYAEGKKVNEKITELSGGQHEIFQIDKHILTNNLYGVDLNNESVEITKLSLWIKTANKYSELTALDDNIKCGNSLIDDPDVAGDKAFNWFKEFPTVFPGYRDYSPKNIVPGYEEKTIEEIRERRLQEPGAEYMGETSNYKPMIIHEPSYSYKVNSKGFEKHGFDVVIWNPPYGAAFTEEVKVFIRNNYYSMEGEFDSYLYFYELSLKISKNNSYISFITPNNLLLQKYGRKLRELILKNSLILKIVNLGTGIFEEAVVPAMILLIKKCLDNFNDSNLIYYIDSQKVKIIESRNTFELRQFELLNNTDYQFNFLVGNNYRIIIDKMEVNSLKLNKIVEIKIGIECTDEYIDIVPSFQNSKPLVRGRNFKKYSLDFGSDPRYVNYERKLLHRAREERLFLANPKILVRQTGDSIIATVDTNQLYAWKSVFVLLLNNENFDLKYILALLNSRLINFYYHLIVGETGRVFAQIKGVNLDKIPVKNITNYSQTRFIALADIMLDKNKELQEAKNKFINLLKDEFNIEKLSTKLQNWTNISWSDFLAELKKLKIELSGVLKDDWYDRFNRLGAKAREIKQTITATDKEIDKMVYELYGLNEEEIKIVEGEE